MSKKKNINSPTTLGQSMVDSIKIINGLNVDELIALNKMIVSRVKEIRREECVSKAQQFKIGDFVSFEDNAKRREGIVLGINQKTIKVFTTEELSWKISPAFLEKIKKPSSSLEKFAHGICPKIFS